MGTRHPLFDTWEQMLQEQFPNFLRLYVNPYVAQTCLCLSRYVQEAWYAGEKSVPVFQSFLANSFDEAISGAIKLARYCAAAEGRPKAGLVIDPEGRIGPLASVALDSGTIEFIPDLLAVGKEGPDAGKLLRERGRFGFVIVFPPAGAGCVPALDALRDSGADTAPLIIACLSRAGLAHCRRDSGGPWGSLRPDVVLFDESFVGGHVPFGAFAARKTLYDHWNRPGLSTFHSTTYQPNCVSTLHFMRCLERDDPEFFSRLSDDLGRVAADRRHRKYLFARLYNPSLARAAAAVGWDGPGVRAEGHYIAANGRRVFDGVAGVACSIRGHNPAGFCDEIEALGDLHDYDREAANRLQRLTGLGHLVPAVSGASAVESALRIGLAAQFPRKYVLAFRGGFGGKTLLALTGTARDSYKKGLDPLYENVLYIDPFRQSAVEDLEAVFRQYPVGVVQLELIQAVGGVRAIPERVLRYLDAQKQSRDYLLFVDEVQTGMYRTGPFVRSRELGISPDLLTVGKGTSDMMFPFAVTLYSDRVREKLRARNLDLPDVIRQRSDYEFGYKTLINVLDRAEAANTAARVREAGELFAKLLGEGLSSCRAVREVRAFGLLIAIELDIEGGPRRWFRKQAGSLYAMNLLRHRQFPVFLGYCQYEPHVLKLTPPLSITPDEVRRVCETITSVLRRPLYRLLPPVVAALAKSLVKGKWEAYREGRASHERLER